MLGTMVVMLARDDFFLLSAAQSTLSVPASDMAFGTVVADRGGHDAHRADELVDGGAFEHLNFLKTTSDMRALGWEAAWGVAGVTPASHTARGAATVRASLDQSFIGLILKNLAEGHCTPGLFDYEKPIQRPPMPTPVQRRTARMATALACMEPGWLSSA